MGQSADQIRREIDQSRDNAGAKIDQLQTQVQDTAQGVKESVQGTAEKVVDDLKGSVDDTVETVRQNLDLREHIKERPLLSLGVALIGGFMVGGMTGNDKHDHHDRSWSAGHVYPPAGSGGGTSSGYADYQQHSTSGSSGVFAQGLRTAAQKTGLEDTISNAAAALIGSVTDQLKTTLDDTFPGFSDKMNTAKSTSGDFFEKSKEAQDQSAA